LRFAGSVTLTRARNSVLLSSETALLLENCSKGILDAFKLLERGVDYSRLEEIEGDKSQLEALIQQLIHLEYVVEDFGRQWAGTRLEKQLNGQLRTHT
jgi:hypothetical protein